MHRVLYIFLILLVPAGSSCVESFDAGVGTFGTGLLVVEGYIEIGKAVTRIKLSKTTSLQNSPVVTEDNASIVIENKDGASYPVHKKGNGVYESDTLELAPTHQYRLKIESNEKVYISEFVTPMTTPMIDSITWRRNSEKGLTIYANAHDVRKESHYYQWHFDEVWEIASQLYSYWTYEYPKVIERKSEEVRAMQRCWRYASGLELVTANSGINIDGVVRNQVVTTIPWQDERLRFRYSILVNQHVISQQEYNFLETIKKNNADLGGFFGAQPSGVSGNIRCLSSNEHVIGYIGAYTSSRHRIFIHNDEVPNWQYVYPKCITDTLTITGYGNLSGYLDGKRIVDVMVDGTTREIYKISTALAICADCRVVAGTGNKPDFWAKEDLKQSQKSQKEP